MCLHPHSQMFIQTFSLLSLLKGSGDDKSNGKRHGPQGKHPHATVTNTIPASQKKPALNPRALPWPTFLINTTEAPGERSQNLATGCFKGRRVTVPPTTQGQSIATCLRRPTALRCQKRQAKANKYGSSRRNTRENANLLLAGEHGLMSWLRNKGE